MQEQLHESGQKYFTGANLDTPFDPAQFQVVPCPNGNTQWALRTDIGRLSVMDRMTGFGYRDFETGFMDTSGTFWLAQGQLDVRRSGVATLGEAIAWVKERATGIYRPS